MHPIFRFVGWYNDNHTGEQFLAVLLVISVLTGLITSQLINVNFGFFSFGIGLVLVGNGIIVLYVSRWYTGVIERRFDEAELESDSEEHSN